MSNSTVTCARCHAEGPRMAFRPFNNAIGQRAFDEICADCWAAWLKAQQQLINHYNLDLRDPKAKEFLFRNMEQFLFAAGGMPLGAPPA